MTKWIFHSLIFIVFGMIVLVFPNIVNYANTETWYVDLAKLLKDYPNLKISVGLVSIVAGVAGVVYAVIIFIRKKTAFVVQQSGDGDYGNPCLKYPKMLIGNQETLVYENITSLNRCDSSTRDLDKKRIARFYGNLQDKTRLAFLSVALFPFIVYSGFIVGNAGQKVTYFHYDRNKSKSRWVKPGFKILNSLFEDERSLFEKDKETLTVCVSVSYEIDKESVFNQFPNSNIVFLKSSKIGTEVIRNRKTLNDIADTVRETINKEAKDHKSVNLLLSCPAELCFAIGCRLSSPGLPLINVYNFNRKKFSNKWDWHITLDK